MKFCTDRSNAPFGMAQALVISTLLCLATTAPAQSVLGWPADPFAAFPGSSEPDSPTDFGVPPLVLISSYFGGGLTDTITTIRTNAAGEFYVAGRTTSDDMPTTPGADQFHGGLSDGFVAKFSADGRLIYSTYIGNGADDFITGMALDAAGNAYVVGYAVVPPSTDAQAFVIKVTDTGGGHLTFTPNNVFGGPSQFPFYGGDDRATDIAIDAAGNVIVVGFTSSAVGFPQLNPIPGNATLGGTLDGFIRRYNSNLVLLSSTYLGGPNQQQINAVDVGPAGNITIAGWDNNWDTTLQHHVWVARIKADVSQVLWAKTFIGDVEEEALDVRVSVSGDALVGGWTESDDFFTVNDPMMGTFPGLDQHYDGYQDGFLLVAANADGALRYSSYVGGPGVDFVRAVERASNNDIIVIGDVQSNPSNVTTKDAFLVRFNNVLQVPQSRDYSATFGSSSDDYGLALTKAQNGSLYIAGSAGASNFFTTSGAFMPTSPWPPTGFFMRLDDAEEGSDILLVSSFQ
ncbi:MAG: SBBP repeat-containing protein [Dokdonella sp.]